MKSFTEIISKYINNELSDSDKAAFEKELTNNPELKKEYDLQLQVIEGVKRMGVKNQVSSSFKSVKTKQFIKKVVIGAAIAITVIGAVLLIKNVADKPTSQVLYELNEQGQKTWSEADKKLDANIFKINPLRDTIIETENGIVLSIPAHAFVNNKGQSPANTIDLEIKEAMTAAEIIRAGLNTMSNDKLLETGGMFYINARDGEENLNIDKSKALNANIPVNNAKKDMLLFRGERNENGNINWVDPKPLKKKLTTVDILKLNFYPEHFLDSVKAVGFNKKDKKLTDSVYYSYSGYCDVANAVPTPTFELEDEPASDTIAVGPVRLTASSALSRLDTLLEKQVMSSVSNCEIDPSRIKAIWDKKFNHTILATKEFEERLKVIFTTCNAEVLNVYINNLDKDLYEIDSMAANLLSGEEKKKFLEFYYRRNGGVEISDAQSKKLQAYFEEKRAIYTNAITNTLKKLYAKEAQQSSDAFKKKLAKDNSDWLRANTTFAEELDLNMDEAYKQLGMPRIKWTGGFNYVNYYYSAPIVLTGWYNVDRYVFESTMNRTTLDYTDPKPGKKAVIKYEPVTVIINNIKDYDRVVSYMIPDKLSSFQLMTKTATGAKEKLNELMHYSIVTIGYKGNSIYYEEIKDAKAQSYTIDLSKVDAAELDKKLNTSFPLNKPADLLKDIDYNLFDLKETVRQNNIKNREQIRARLLPVVFPCVQNIPAQQAAERDM